MRWIGGTLLAGLALLALTDCSQGTSNTANTAAAAAPPAPAAPLPAWATALIGKSLSATYPSKDGVCVGNVDTLDTTTAPPTLHGWAWDTVGKRPVAQLLVTDGQGDIVGAGESGAARPDVVANRKDVTTPNVGWAASVGTATGDVQVYGVTGTSAVCLLGHMQVGAG
ncbi:MAG TPA: hypothetical protein VGL58_00935 [Caulobacteraceae bacterium]|jgi:hypothetical protein